MVNDMYRKYCEIRDNLGLKDSEVANGANVTKSTFSDWKAGRYQPKQDKLQRICDFLGVRLEYLTGENTDGYYINEETAKAAQEIFENKELRLLFDTARDSAPEDIKAVHSMLLALKRKENGKD